MITEKEADLEHRTKVPMPFARQPAAASDTVSKASPARYQLAEPETTDLQVRDWYTVLPSHEGVWRKNIERAMRLGTCDCILIAALAKDALIYFVGTAAVATSKANCIWVFGRHSLCAAPPCQKLLQVDYKLKSYVQAQCYPALLCSMQAVSYEDAVVEEVYGDLTAQWLKFAPSMCSSALSEAFATKL